ncbi:hypothetical protein SISNIDRAFT_460970 [Sistotremastrum niveocremeum HHB9708]|uniref:Xylanolytic transcriptional activator regulatory domain-containing protein n=1 Tax=Sistotremastrum niveocremeum HHB9708 TaxID=1314777 RepID=A0A164N4W5_9AGAM|nr:hypothetical protein SISNIDRAFT_460970 [Sistotremastrum niveocremeum HHB9708]
MSLLVRRRRIRCDEGHPCQSCLTANSACTFEEPGKRTHPHKSKRSTTLEDRMHHLESLIQSIPAGLLNGAANGNGTYSETQAGSSNGTVSFPPADVPYPRGVPPPSLTVYPLINPSTHFPRDDLAEATSRLSIAPSYLYFDDEGSTRWQGETSGLPLLDLLVELATSVEREPASNSYNGNGSFTTIKTEPSQTPVADWFPDRKPRRPETNPETLWKLITSHISPDLMDSLVQCFLSTTYYLMPFLHVPTFLADYGNPRKWGEPGFACFILALCAISSRHVDDPRVRGDSSDSLAAGVAYFELFNKIRSSTADRPTLYTIQGVFVAAVYAVGLGKLSKASALLAEAITLSVDAGLHRSADAYDLFDPIEDEVRKRTFFCVYMWDKQAGAAFGRPPMIRLRDVDAAEPAIVDDEFITSERLGPQPLGVESRMSAFVYTVRLFIVLEAVLDAPPSSNTMATPFRSHASNVLSGFRRHNDLREEEALLDEICLDLPAYWKPTPETGASEDVIRITQSQRIHCLEQFIRMLIYRHRFSELVTRRTLAANSENGNGNGVEQSQSEAERDAMMASHACAVRIVAAHMHTASSQLMTYYGVHVIHQLTQAGRTLVAVLLNCKTEDLSPLIGPSLDALKSCVGLLRRFSARYVCGLRNGDLIEEFCRLTRIPLEPTQLYSNPSRPPWLRPVPKKQSTARSPTSNDSPQSSGGPSPSAAVDTLFSSSSPGFNPTTLTAEPSSSTDLGSATNGAGPQSFLEPVNMQDPGSMSSAEFMAMLNDPSGIFDLSNMFHPGAIPPHHHSMAGARTTMSPNQFVNGILDIGVSP